MAETGAWLHADEHQGVPLRTLGDALQRFRDEVTPLKRSATKERYLIDRLLHEPLCQTELSALTPSLIAAYRDRRLRSVKPATVCRALGLMQQAVDTAMREWGSRMPDGNPFKQVRKPRVSNRRERRLQVGEWDALMREAARCGNPLMPVVLTLALETGMRRGELLSLRWCNVNLQRCTVMLPMTKNGCARTVPLTPLAVTTLCRLSPTDDRVLPISGNAVRLAWEKLRLRAGVSDLRFHDLRHEAISRFVERGLSVMEVQLISGHRDTRMLSRYVHLSAVDLVAKLHSIA